MLAIFAIFLVFIGLAVGLVWYFLAHDHGEKEPIGALWIAAGFGFLGIIIAGFLETHVLPANFVNSIHSTSSLVIPALLIGIIEESAKFLPLAFFIYKKRYFNEHTDGVIYFAIAGLGFGLPENILYTIQYGSKVGISRILLTPFFHAAITSFIGYFLIKAKLREISLKLVGVILIVAMLLHGIYDFGLLSGVMLYTVISLMITVVMAASMFLFFMRATEIDQDEGLSVVGNNSFCRHCGKPNPSHQLFCTHCGQHA
jgi:RsiW-degrading membrane proteinase PrsW (M82 family)